MTFLDVLEILQSAATATDPNATYFRGRISDVSLNSHTAETNLIYVLDTIQAAPDTDNRMEQWSIRIGFFRQDSTSSESMEANQSQVNEESRETIFSETLALARKYYSALFNEDSLMLTGSPRYTQLTRELQGTYSGWGLDINVFVDVGCDDISIADAIYQNSDDTFEVSIKRGAVYTAPNISITDSDGDIISHPANKNFTCTPGTVGTEDYEVYVDSVLVASGTLDLSIDQTININL